MEHNPQLTSSEMAVLWNTYMENSMADCMILHFSKINEDVSIDPLLETAKKNANFALSELKQLFMKENIPVPIGFSESDINLQAPRLFSDMFALKYLKYMSAIATATYSVALELSAKMEIRKFFTEMVHRSTAHFNEASDLMLDKGILIRAPIIPTPEKAEFVKKESFLSGVLGEHRPLTAIEISHIGKNLETNTVGRTFILGFSQVAQSPKVRQYMIRGKDIAKKHESIFREILLNDDIPLPSAWDSTISQSNVAPFSDKLLMFQINLLNATGVANYGAAIAGSLRKDLGVHYSRLMTEVIQYAEDGVKLMIENSWLEQPPSVPNRELLRK